MIQKYFQILKICTNVFKASKCILIFYPSIQCPFFKYIHFFQIFGKCAASQMLCASAADHSGVYVLGGKSPASTALAATLFLGEDLGDSESSRMVTL
jgi:hypothetical protein